MWFRMMLLSVALTFIGALAVRSMAADKPTTQPAKTYVCPMDKDVVSSKPGKCPKCGMTLVLKKQSPKNGQTPAHSADSSDHSGMHDHH